MCNVYAAGGKAEELNGLLQVNNKRVNSVFLKEYIRQNCGADIPGHFLCPGNKAWLLLYLIFPYGLNEEKRGK